MTPGERLRYLGSLRFWLTPGMGVKRHVALAVGGALLLVLGTTGVVLWALAEGRQVVAQPIENVLAGDPWRRVGGWVSLGSILLGSGLAIAAVGRLNRSLLSNWTERPYEAAQVIHRRVRLARGPHVVALGGGSGLSNLLRGLREHTSNLTAVVAVSDDGGSSGRLRAAFDMPAPGDLTDCLAALSDHESELTPLLQYRFERGGELTGHTFGNLLITTLTEVQGDFADALRLLNRLLNLSGSVYPATPQPVTLEVTKVGGEVVQGESRMREVGGAVRTAAISPAAPDGLPEVGHALTAADLVVLGPGSLFSSTMPPLLVPSVAAALRASPTTLVYVANIMTEAGETNGFDAFDHVQALVAHGCRWPDVVVVNATPVDEPRRAKYREEGADVVDPAVARFAEAGVAVTSLPLLSDGAFAQHDSGRLAEALIGIARRHARRRARPVKPVEVAP
ncbi:MAG: uridine diphosphate-N-acetylglucosamine-binding protein YvcK [Trueperaceae bacterium]